MQTELQMQRGMPGIRTMIFAKEAWFKEADGVILNNKYNLWGTNGKPISGGCIMPFRTADMYLLKAEALYRLGRESEAKWY